jgi:glycosyltransferase involved in cell wall biosynthesis
VKVVVLNTAVPFVRGGAEHLADSLVTELGRRGHEAQLIRLPFRWDTPLAVAECMAAAAATVVHGADVVIGLKFPMWLVPHERRMLWVLHQFRQVYDFWGTSLQSLPADEESERLRQMITEADTRALGTAQGLYCISAVGAARMRRYNGLEPAVVPHPLGDPTIFRTQAYDDFVLAVGRVNEVKRQHLLVEAMAHSRGSWRLVVAGAPEAPGDLRRLECLVEREGLSDRVVLIPEYISEETKVDLLSRARAVAYLPYDEDSYGYVTVEAMLSGKPVVTASDSGGTLELVRHERTGLVAEPRPEALAGAMDRLVADEDWARHLGEAGRERIVELDLSWDRTVRTLLS